MKTGEFPWIRQCGSYQCTLCFRQILRLCMEMFFGYGISAIDSITHLDTIQIDLHDALLRPERLDQEREVGLHSLAHPRAFRPAEDILGRLLRNGAAPALPPAALAFLHHRVEGDDVETAVPEEVVVLRRDGGAVHIGRNLLYRHPFLVDARAVLHRLHTLERRHRRVHPTIQNRQQDTDSEQDEYALAQPSPKLPTF